MIKTKEELVKELKVIYEDNHIIVVEKMVNVLSQKDITCDIDMTEIVKLYLKDKYQKPGNVYLGLLHRLDRRVGGVLVLAKSSKAAARLSLDFNKHNIDKYYLVKVKGKIVNNGTINIKITKDEDKKIAYVDNNGKESILDYEVIGYDNNDTFLKVKLITGRYNQIRVSFSYINHPVINDYKYDKDCLPTKEDIGLWCYKISITHPVTKEKMIFTDIPDRKLWDKLQIKKE